MDLSLMGSLIGIVIGGMDGGPAGAVIGGAAGGLFGSILPITTSDIAVKIVTGLSADSVKKSGRFAWNKINAEERLLLSEQLEEAFREAFQEAVFDIGGATCFRKQRGGVRDKEWNYVFYVSTLSQHDDLLAMEVCGCLQELAVFPDGLITAESLVQIIPDHINSKDCDRWTQGYFNEAVVDPFLEEYNDLVVRLQELQKEIISLTQNIYDLQGHLYNHLFERTRLHSLEKLKKRPEAWRHFMIVMQSTIQNLLMNEIEQARQDRADISDEIERLYQFVLGLELDLLSPKLEEIAESLGDLGKRQDVGFKDLLEAVGNREYKLYDEIREVRESVLRLEKLELERTVREGNVEKLELWRIASELSEWKDAHTVVQDFWLALGAIDSLIERLNSELSNDLIIEINTKWKRSRWRGESVLESLLSCEHIRENPKVKGVCRTLSTENETNIFYSMNQLDCTSKNSAEIVYFSYIELSEMLPDAMKHIDQQIKILAEVLATRMKKDGEGIS